METAREAHLALNPLKELERCHCLAERKIDVERLRYGLWLGIHPVNPYLSQDRGWLRRRCAGTGELGDAAWVVR